MSRKKYFPTEDELALIRDNYDGTTVKTNKIMRLTGHKYPRWYIRRIACDMGLTRAKPVVWSEAEIEYLHRAHPKQGYVALRNGLMRINGGISRSRTAIRLKTKCIGINKRSGGFTLRMVENLLGADHHKIGRWMRMNLLTAKRKGTERTAAQGGDMWHFEADALRDFVINNPDQIDIRRVEKHSFIDLLAGRL